jgi:hypothetical protein
LGVAELRSLRDTYVKMSKSHCKYGPKAQGRHCVGGVDLLVMLSEVIHHSPHPNLQYSFTKQLLKAKMKAVLLRFAHFDLSCNSRSPAGVNCNYANLLRYSA